MQPISAIDFVRKPECAQVYLMASPASHPFAFAIHPWFVIGLPGGGFERYEIRHYRCDRSPCNGYLYKNLQPPFVGIEQFGLLPDGLRFAAQCIGYMEGDKGSLAGRMSVYVQESFSTYPDAHRYHFIPGPNSNTYVQRILDAFPECTWELPWNAFGKGNA